LGISKQKRGSAVTLNFFVHLLKEKGGRDEIEDKQGLPKVFTMRKQKHANIQTNKRSTKL